MYKCQQKATEGVTYQHQQSSQVITAQRLCDKTYPWDTTRIGENLKGDTRTRAVSTRKHSLNVRDVFCINQKRNNQTKHT